MTENKILLSVIVVVGPCRTRGQRLLDALCTQTVFNSLEIVVLDLGAYSARKLKTSHVVRTVHLSRPETESWPRARRGKANRALSRGCGGPLLYPAHS
jgi:hypothetical protein